MFDPISGAGKQNGLSQAVAGSMPANAIASFSHRIKADASSFQWDAIAGAPSLCPSQHILVPTSREDVNGTNDSMVAPGR